MPTTLPRFAPRALALLAACSAGACAPPAASARAVAPRGVVDSLDVRTLNIVDERGQARIRIGAPLSDLKGRKRAVTAHGFQFLDASGREVGGGGMIDRVGIRGFCFDSSAGYEAICLGLLEGGAPGVVLRDSPTGAPADAQERVTIRVVDGVATIQLKDGQGQTRLRLEVDREGRPRVEGLGAAPAAK